MRWLLLADVHANLEALNAVLQVAQANWGKLRVACAGDIVGYGPNPNECIDRLREENALCILGNHDLMVLDRLTTSRCVPAGIRAVHWTRACLRADERTWLESLPPRQIVEGEFVLCHGSLNDPDTYVTTGTAALAQIRQFNEQFPGCRLLVSGHTHRQLWLQRGDLRAVDPGFAGRITPGQAVLVNPGSVGQSRDRQPLARYAVLDTDEGIITFGATAYDICACAAKIRAAGLITPLYRTLASEWLERSRRALHLRRV